MLFSGAIYAVCIANINIDSNNNLNNFSANTITSNAPSADRTGSVVLTSDDT